ncbi:acetyltransferase [Vibrio cholerae]|nr:acetyltransferase [Vibrio cholerae]TYA84567.1 acetyltransferase [Vibrio cholerae]
MQLLCLSLVVVRCQPLRRALTLICIYINKFNRLTDF